MAKCTVFAQSSYRGQRLFSRNFWRAHFFFLFSESIWVDKMFTVNIIINLSSEILKTAITMARHFILNRDCPRKLMGGKWNPVYLKKKKTNFSLPQGYYSISHINEASKNEVKHSHCPCICLWHQAEMIVHFFRVDICQCLVMWVVPELVTKKQTPLLQYCPLLTFSLSFVGQYGHKKASYIWSQGRNKCDNKGTDNFSEV